MTEPLPDPFDPRDPSWAPGGLDKSAEDTAYLLAKARQYRQDERPRQEREIAERHAELVVIAEKVRALNLAAISLLEVAATGANVREQAESLAEMEHGLHVLGDCAIWLARLLGRDHGEEIAEVLDRMRRATEGEV